MDSLVRLALLFLAWLGPALCVVVSAWQTRRLRRLAAPTREALGERLARCASALERAQVRQDLREERRDAERGIAVAALWPHSLSRVSLATGTALAVANLAHRGAPLSAQVLAATIAFAGGFAGLAGCMLFGQQAKSATAELRRGWREAVEMAGRE